eukprot:4728012-Alexandrium_andersonii.AAC.1
MAAPCRPGYTRMATVIRGSSSPTSGARTRPDQTGHLAERGAQPRDNRPGREGKLSLIHISEPTRLALI